MATAITSRQAAQSTRSIQEGAVFKLTVAELADIGLGESAVIELSDGRLQPRYFNVDDAGNAEPGSPAE
jgi:hypothetical protein